MRKEKQIADIAAAALSHDLWFSNQPQHCENCITSDTVSASFVEVRKMRSDCQIQVDILYVYLHVRTFCIDVANHPRGLHSILFAQELQLIVVWFMFIARISGWTWCENCGPSTLPSLSTARIPTHAPSQPLSVKNGVQHIIATCGDALLLQMCSAHSSKRGSTIKRLFTWLAEGKCCYYICNLGILI